MKITKQKLKRLIREALSGPPQTVEEWMYWGGEFGLSAEEDNDGQTIFYVERDHPDFKEIISSSETAGASVDVDYSGQAVIYTGMNNAGPM